MTLRLVFPSLAVALASPALAGITFGGSVGQMTIGVGFVDSEAPDPYFASDSATTANPPSGSYLTMGGWFPGRGVIRSGLVFSGSPSDRRVFTFENVLELSDFSSTSYDFAASGNEVILTSETEFIVSLRGTLLTSGGGGAGFDVLSDALAPVYFTGADNPIALDVTLGPGTYTFGWGATVGPAGGSAEFRGEMSFIAIPAPGTAALLMLAMGVMTSYRRR